MREDFDQLLAELAKVALRIFDSGRRLGEEQERARVLSAFAPCDDRSLRRLRSERYARVSPPVFRAVHDMASASPGGVNAKELFSHLKMQGTQLNPTQVRAAMKYLLSVGRLWRPSPGRYLPRQTVPPTGPAKLSSGSNTDPSPNLPDLPVAQPCGHRGRAG